MAERERGRNERGRNEREEERKKRRGRKRGRHTRKSRQSQRERKESRTVLGVAFLSGPSLSSTVSFFSHFFIKRWRKSFFLGARELFRIDIRERRRTAHPSSDSRQRPRDTVPDESASADLSSFSLSLGAECCPAPVVFAYLLFSSRISKRTAGTDVHRPPWGDTADAFPRGSRPKTASQVSSLSTNHKLDFSPPNEPQTR
ncbi:putative transmembrane protein [Toxoplasma gondii VAND]|uniref:Putative transmembrane protein n=1 Tax=Toxoplasma gondii VAND TaxID=933077 RepID=A0A086PYL3_TOXGO|nr:putative transmembrane protein [Toxoplasma gondii VAND]